MLYATITRVWRLVPMDAQVDIALLLGQEYGRFTQAEHAGVVETNGVLRSQPLHVFQQKAGALKFGSLVTPVGVDWDGRIDLLAEDPKTSVRFYLNEPDGTNA